MRLVIIAALIGDKHGIQRADASRIDFIVTWSQFVLLDCRRCVPGAGRT
jgi:hypothetical protein